MNIRINGVLKSINASSAYARGATGARYTIGITDSGLDDTHLRY